MTGSRKEEKHKKAKSKTITAPTEKKFIVEYMDNTNNNKSDDIASDGTHAHTHTQMLLEQL